MFLLVEPAAVSMVDVAQVVEPWIVIPVVVGSSPIVHPISDRPGLVRVVESESGFWSNSRPFMGR